MVFWFYISLEVSVKALSVGACCNSCNKEARCQAFTYAEDGSQMCYLKYSADSVYDMKHRVSGLLNVG